MGPIELSKNAIFDDLDEFIQESIDSDYKKSYIAYAQRKVERSRSEIRLGQGIPNNEVNAEFAKKRANAIKNLS